MSIFRELRVAHITRYLVYLFGGIIFSLIPARAVEMGGSYNTTAPTNTNIPNWESGWGSGGITGWNYVGRVNGGGGVYLGNDWVLTAGHVGTGDFLLDGLTYSVVAGSSVGISNGDGTADLNLFKISTAPTLPALALSMSAPTVASVSNPGASVAMLGYGDAGGPGSDETWGLNSVTANNMLITPGGYTYVSTDFQTAYGTTAYGSNNSTQLVVGDSGGGDFIYNYATGDWELAGINEAIDTTTHDSYMVQLSTYEPQIDAITGVPEPETWALLVTGLTIVGYCSRYRPAFRL